MSLLKLEKPVHSSAPDLTLALHLPKVEHDFVVFLLSSLKRAGSSPEEFQVYLSIFGQVAALVEQGELDLYDVGELVFDRTLVSH